MASTSSLKLTVDDYLALPEDGRYYQLIDGDLVTAPSPLRYHQQILVRLSHRIMTHLNEHPGGELNIGPFDVHLDKHNVFQPDLCWFSDDRLRLLSRRGAEGAPDWVVEVLSESTARTDRVPKRTLYAKFGVREFWLIDPESDLIERYLLQDDPSQPEGIYRLGEHETIVPACLPELTLRLDGFLGEGRERSAVPVNYLAARTSWMMICRVVRPRKVLRSIVNAMSHGGSGRATSPPPKKTASCSA
jgi:Uma2 family endonuclease